MNRDWLAPLTGLAFVGMTIVAFVIGGEPPDVEQPVREIVGHYADNKQSVIIGAGLAGLAAALLVFFGGSLRRALSEAEGPGGVLSAVALAGAAIMAVGIAIDATISFALAEAVDDVAPAAVQSLQALWDNDFMPIAVGSSVLFLSAGISIVRHRALPRWLGWVAILLGVLASTPIGYFSFVGGGVWIAVVSVLLALRARAAGA